MTILDAKIPEGPLAEKWDSHCFKSRLVNPANKRKYRIIIVGTGLAPYTQEPWLENGTLQWRPAPDASGDEAIVRPVNRRLSADGGITGLK